MSKLKPIMTIKKNNPEVVVADPYAQKVIKDINSYKENSPLDAVESVINNSGPLSGIRDSITAIETTENMGLGERLLNTAKDVGSQIKDSLQGGFANYEDLTDSLKVDLVSGVVGQYGITTDMVNNLLENGVSLPDPEDLIGPGVDLVENLTGYMGLSNLEVQIDGVKKLINCDPSDLRGMSNILEGLTGKTDLLGIIDIGALTSTVSTVMKFADKWNVPELVNIAIDKVEDVKLQKELLLKGALTASRSGSLPLTKYYTDKLGGYDSNLVRGNADTLIKSLLQNYRIVEEDQDKSNTRLGDSLYEYCVSLIHDAFPDMGETDIADLSYLVNVSKPAQTVLGASSHRLYMFDLKPNSCDNIIREFFPNLTTDFNVGVA